MFYVLQSHNELIAKVQSMLYVKDLYMIIFKQRQSDLFTFPTVVILRDPS
jgi:hypothetical protein